jgi:hypothetical protein
MSDRTTSSAPGWLSTNDLDQIGPSPGIRASGHLTPDLDEVRFLLVGW